MAAIPLSLGCLLFMNLLHLLIAANDPPIYLDHSYKAFGEIVEDLSDPMSEITMQLAFEENYDNSTKDSAFTVWEAGTNITFLENGLTGQTLKYFQGTNCIVESKQDWLTVGTSLPGYGTKDGRISFSLRQLFTISSDSLVESEKAKPAEIRGIPATSWQYKLKQTTSDNIIEATVTAYFSNKGWSTTSDIGVQVPLGYEMNKITKNMDGSIIDVTNMFVNVFVFILDDVDQKALAPRENVFCPGRTHPLAFPKFPNWKAFSIKSEIILPDDQEIKNMDVYFDSLNKMLRVDLDRMDNQEIGGDFVTARKSTSQITSKDLGATFKIELYRRSATCTVTPVNEYKFDMQELVNPKLDNKLWSIDYIMGSNTTNYTYIGKTSKREIPCHLFQGIRKDWPDVESNVTSIWEWCLSTDFQKEVNTVRFRDGELGIISAYVNVTESGNEEIMVGFRMIHHFYDIVQEDPHALSLNQFDVSRWCFSGDSQKRRLQFVTNVTVTEDNVHIFENATSDTTFLRLWRNSIADACGLLVPYMRITKMRASILDKKVVISFILLGVHNSLPKESKEGQPSLDDAQKALKKSVDSGGLTIRYLPSKKAQAINIAALQDSLGDSEDVVLDRNTPVPTRVPKTTASLPVITISTDSSRKTISTDSSRETISTDSSRETKTPTPSGGTTNDVSRTPPVPSTTPKPIGDKDPQQGYGPGTVAGTSIGMLLAGITMGAGGAFYRLKGFQRR